MGKRRKKVERKRVGKRGHRRPQLLGGSVDKVVQDKVDEAVYRFLNNCPRPYHWEQLPKRRPTEVEKKIDVAQFNPWCAEIALAYYNRRQLLDYELVKVTGISAALVEYIWIHINFEAKPKFAMNRVEAPQTKKFFAELRQPCPYQFLVETCLVLEPNCCDSENFLVCGLCHPEKSIRHPTSGYFWAEAEGGAEYLEGIMITNLGSDKLRRKRLIEIEAKEGASGTAFWHAETALAYYNKRECVDFELERVVETHSSCCPPDSWAHLKFMARPKCSANGIVSASELFLAEVVRARPYQIIVKTCFMATPNDDEGRVSCELCACRNRKIL